LYILPQLGEYCKGYEVKRDMTSDSGNSQFTGEFVARRITPHPIVRISVEVESVIE
jgi:hypothetical protein